MLNVLFVHAYAITVEDGEEKPGDFMVATIEHAARCHSDYDEVILLGGWHNKELGENRLLSDYMREQLFKQGVPPRKMKNLKDFFFGFNYMPPRSTEEEIILAKSILSRIEGEVSVTACFVSQFQITACWYYEKLQIRLDGLELVIVTRNPKDDLNTAKGFIEKFKALQLDPALSSEKNVAHLASRTLGEGYERPDPAGFFI